MNVVDIQGPFWKASGQIIQVINPVAEVPIPLYAEDFNKYTEGVSPKEWRETGDLSEQISDGRFKIKELDENNKVFTAEGSQLVFTHIHTLSSVSWNDYHVSGRFRYVNSSGKIGVSFLSQYRENGQSSFYLLSNEGDGRKMVLKKRINGGSSSTLSTADVAIPNGKWIEFHVVVENTGSATRITASILVDGQESTLTYEDTSNDRLTSGTIGLFGHGLGTKQFDQIVVRGLGAIDYPALQSLFIDYPPTLEEISKQLFIPGAIVAVCKIDQVEVRLFGEDQPPLKWGENIDNENHQVTINASEVQGKIREGQLSLLVLRKIIGAEKQVFRCLNGYISLDHLSPLAEADQVLFNQIKLETANTGNRTGMANLTGTLSVNSSGLGIFGAVTLPWMSEATQVFPGPFQLFKTFAPDQEEIRYRLKLEPDRLTAGEKQQWVSAWQEFSAAVNPLFPQLPLSKRPIQPSSPAWFTFEIINIFEIPRLYWELEIASPQSLTDPVLSFEKGAVRLLLTDQQLYDEDNAPQTVAQILPDQIKIAVTNQEDTRKGLELIINPLEIEGAEAEASARITYQANRKEHFRWSESLKAKKLNLAYDVVETPRQLRNFMGISTPSWTGTIESNGQASTPLDEVFIWPHIPLENGWCQIPVFNLTEQIYIDTGLSNDIDDLELIQQNSFNGAVTFQNRALALQQEGKKKEHPWDITILNARAVAGKIFLKRNNLNKLEMEEIKLVAREPDVALNGFLWMSTQKTTARDALPDLSNWINGIIPVNLKTVRNDPVFPPLLFFSLEEMNFKIPDEINKGERIYAELDEWGFRYQANEELINNLKDKGLLAGELFKENTPLIWIRHHAIPCIQALPITQTKEPPNYPSPSRQLAPFIFEPTQTGFPDNWQFFSSGGAKTWPKASGMLTPAPEWMTLEDLPMVALSLPGLLFDPKRGLSINNAFEALKVQYRLDLPYTDEINALAQLSKEVDSQEQENLFPDDPPITPPAPPGRHGFADHWIKLANKANLASVDAVAALSEENENIFLNYLIEPFHWRINLEALLDQYPGSLKMEDVTTQEFVLLQHLAALQGLSGQFTTDENGQLSLVSSGNSTMEVLGHSMGNWLTEDRQFYRDQRGLYRSAPYQDPDLPLLLQTEVKLEEETSSYKLSSLLSSLPLTIAANQEWQLWFKDVPLRQEGDQEIFEASDIRSEEAVDKGVNDPESLSRNFNFLQGFEWRIRNKDRSVPAEGFLPLLNLYFYPLGLHKIDIRNKNIATLELKGRLQLPYAENAEQETLNNVVIVTFKDADGSLTLEEVSPFFDNHPIEWPLEVDSAKSQGEIPRLYWSSILLHRQNGIPSHFEIVEPKVRFFLFETQWTIALNNLDLSTGAEQDKVNSPENSDGDFQAMAMEGYSLSLQLDPPFQHQLDVELRVRLGNQDRPDFNALLNFPILNQNGDSLTSKETNLFGRLPIEGESTSGGVRFHYANLGLQFSWSDYVDFEEGEMEEPIYFFPGIPFKKTQNIDNPGFAAFTFKPRPVEDGIPELALETGFLEMVFSISWNEFIQGESGFSRESIFTDAAGELTIGYTAEFKNGDWHSQILLNGYLEVKNLISWPASLSFDPATHLLAIPDIANDEADLSHLRHTLRILLNQHQFPAELLEIGTGRGTDQLLFNLKKNKTWQFLAVAEHQIIKVNLNGETATDEEEFRWVSLQEIRWLPVQRYKYFIDFLSGKKVNPEDLENDGEPTSSANFQDGDKVTVKGRVFNDLGQGIPNLRVQLYIRQQNTFVAMLGIPIGVTNDDGQFEFEEIPVRSILNAQDDQVYFKVWKPGAEYVMPDDSPAWNFDMADSGILLNINFEPRRADYLSLPLSSLMSDALAVTDPNTIIVEASAPHWIRSIPLESQSFTNVQFLPNGIQSIISSSPVDFKATDPKDPKWHLMTMPFIGRLQLTRGVPEVEDLNKGLYLDPVLAITVAREAGQMVPSLFLALSSWSATTGASLPLKILEGPEVLRFTALDTQVLEENWIRLQNPPPEALPENLTSITASLTQGVSRISRAASMVQTFLPERQYYPPQTNIYHQEYLNQWFQRLNSIDEENMPDMEVRLEDLFGRTGPVSWRENSLLEFSFPDFSHEEQSIPYQWVGLGAKLLDLLNNSVADSPEVKPRRYAAATQIAVPDIKTPMSFAVSPYLGLRFTQTPLERLPVLVSTELLCLDSATKKLRPIISKLWSLQNLLEEVDKDLTLLLPDIDYWASETHARFCPDSPIAMIRLRKVERTSAAGAEAVTTFGFRWVVINTGQRLAKRVFNLRTKVDFLQFREGQFGGFDLPVETINDPSTLKKIGLLANLFELAPPQMVGIKPFYIDPHQLDEKGNGQEHWKEAIKNLTENWPYGLSTLRLSTLYTKHSQGVVGPQEETIEDIQTIKLWWQSIQHFVQFRSSKMNLPVAGLPGKFRAPAIKSLQPVLANLPLPTEALVSFLQPEKSQENGINRIWQSVLPGAIHVFPIGSRPGAPFVFRQMLQTQELVQDADNWRSRSLTSASVPVQHRFPRPVSIPPNQTNHREKALRTWAGYFHPTLQLYAQKQPLDEAFFAPPAKESVQNDQQNALPPARGLTLQVSSPRYGAIPSNWDGKFVLNIVNHPSSSPQAAANLDGWKIIAEIGGGKDKLSLTLFSYEENEEALGQIDEQGNVVLDFSKAQAIIEPGQKEEETLARILNEYLPGEQLDVLFKVRHQETTLGFYQELSLPLTLLTEEERNLPLEPFFIHFEDPEYNRKLATGSAKSVRVFTVEGNIITLRLSADRKQYNPDGKIALRFDILEFDQKEGQGRLEEVIQLEDEPSLEEQLILKLKRVDRQSGVATTVSSFPKGNNPQSLERGVLYEINIADEFILNNNTIDPLAEGDTLQLELNFKVSKEGDNPEQATTLLDDKTILELDIVEEKVDPVPEAAYGLLKAMLNEPLLSVQCARFAWGPSPVRIELVNPEDLLNEVVRRRAVFKMVDTVREDEGVMYGIQKIAQNGSTHIVDFTMG